MSVWDLCLLEGPGQHLLTVLFSINFNYLPCFKLYMTVFKPQPLYSEFGTLMVVRVLELLLTLLSIGLVLNFMKQKFETENEELKKVKLIPLPDVQTTQEVKGEDLTLDP